MSKTVKPSWSFPSKSSQLATFTLTTVGSLLFYNKQKTLLSSSSNGILYQDSITGKIETLGSIFSNETRKSEAACVPSYYREYII